MGREYHGCVEEYNVEKRERPGKQYHLSYNIKAAGKNIKVIKIKKNQLQWSTLFNFFNNVVRCKQSLLLEFKKKVAHTFHSKKMIYLFIKMTPPSSRRWTTQNWTNPSSRLTGQTQIFRQEDRFLIY